MARMISNDPVNLEAALQGMYQEGGTWITFTHPDSGAVVRFEDTDGLLYLTLQTARLPGSGAQRATSFFARRGIQAQGGAFRMEVADGDLEAAAVLVIDVYREVYTLAGGFMLYVDIG